MKKKTKENKKEKIKKPILYPVICTLTVLITLFFTVIGGYNKSYDISVGSVSPEKFVAKNQIENRYATQQLRERAAEEVQTLYIYDDSVDEEIKNSLNIFFENVSEARLSKRPYSLTTYYITTRQADYLCSMEDEEYAEFVNSVNNIVYTILEQGIKEINDKTLSLIRQEIKDSDEKMANLKYQIIAAFVEPNMFPDEETTQKAKQEKMDAVKPVIILQNQKIVDKGEIITEEIYSVLNDCGYVKKDMLKKNLISIIGMSVFMIIFLAVIYVYVRIYYASMLEAKSEMVLIFTIYVLMLAAAAFLKNMPYMFCPVLIFTFLVSMLVNRRLAIMLNFAAAVMCFFIINENVSALFYFSTAGTIASIITRHSYDRTRLVKSSMISCVINAVIAASISCFFDKEIPVIKSAYYALGASIISYITALGSLSIWEILFGIVTDVKLLQLTNPDNVLLRRLIMEAPGTYNHSLVVGNLAEAAAYNIGANPVMAKVGAYYHDIGKLKYPYYFTENIKGENPHDDFDPYKSKKIITEHVSYGMELAKKHKLPDIVKDIIFEHHGTTSVKFFYFKAKGMYPDVRESDFRYNGRIPQSRESAVVMLADTVEAAVRSFNPHKKTRQEIEAFVSKLISDKMADGQLSKSKLMIGDIDIIIDSFMSILEGMYHNRISYPDDKKEDNEENK